MPNGRDPHGNTCKLARALACPVGIECEHGWDVCPFCDPCTCGGCTSAWVVDGEPLRFDPTGKTTP